MMFPYSPLVAAHNLFGGNSSALQNEAKSKTEFLKFMDICEYFFVSHPASGQREGHEHERIMFFSPVTDPLAKQTEITGMAEAIVNFTSILPESAPEEAKQHSNDYRYITSGNSKDVVLIVEKGAYLIGASFSRKLCKHFDYCPHLATIKTLLERAYNAYKLFYGPFGNLFTRDPQLFKCVLERFLCPYLQLFRVDKTPLVDLFSGVDFLPLESLSFLEVHCLMVNCMEEFPQIKKTMFLYQERLVQYNVEKRDLIPLWHFLNRTLIPSAMQAELSPNENNSRRNSRSNCRNGFLIDGSVMMDFLGELSEDGFPRVYISDLDEDGTYEDTEFDLIAYRILNATACFFVKSGKDKSQNWTNLLDRLCDFIDSPMSSIASKIGDKFLTEVTRPPSMDIPYQFIYFNPDSLSLRKSFRTSPIMSSGTAEAHIFPSSMHRLIYETYDKFTADSSLLSQIYLKQRGVRREQDWWIVFKRVERRILALFIPQTAASTIVEIQSTVDSIVRTRFPNLFIS